MTYEELAAGWEADRVWMRALAAEMQQAGNPPRSPEGLKGVAMSNADLIARLWAEAAEAEAEVARLREALHRISLGSQDSGTTKEALGREARAALEKKP